MKQPKLTVVGAGPGDPDLITIKAIKVLQSADVILYDALANEEILAHAPQAEKIFVGKRKGCYKFMQETINDLIVSRAKSNGHVVRLKGGDPFIFGRGGEEMLFAAKNGLEVEVVPGISSASAVPAAKNIPLTLRNASESFWVITGTTQTHQLSQDIRLAANSKATVVILMGMSKLPQIVQYYQEANRLHFPISIIQNGTLPDEKQVTGTMKDILQKVAITGISNPAIIIIGEVVNQQQRLEALRSNLYAVAS